MHERRWLIGSALVVSLAFAATSLSFSAREARRMRAFIREREIPALGLAVASQLDMAAFRYRRAGEELLKGDFILDWIEAGEVNVEALRAFMEKVRAQYGLLDASIVSNRSETYYGTDGRVLKLSPNNVERDGWYYLYRENVLDTTIDAWYYPESGFVGMFVNVPLRDRNGRFIAVVGGGIDTGEFSRIIASIEADHRVRVYMARRDGQLVYSTDRSLLEQPVRNLDELWGMRLADSLRREQKNFRGANFSPGGDYKGTLLWGRYLPEWDTFLVLEWPGSELSRSIREAIAGSVAGELGVWLILLAVTLAAFYVAYRATLSVESRAAARVRRFELALHGEDRLVARLGSRLAGHGPFWDGDPDVAELRREIEGQRRAFASIATGNGAGAIAMDLTEVLEDAITRNSAAAAAKGGTLHLEAGKAIPRFKADPTLLEAAFDELLEYSIGLAERDSAIMLALREGGSSVDLDIAIRLAPEAGKEGAAPALPVLYEAIGWSLARLPEGGGILGLKLSLPARYRSD